jgi:hypothetical protein
MDEITVIIPIHDPSSHQRKHVKRLLNSIKKQTEVPKEIILSGNHPIEYMNSLLEEIRSKIPSRYIQNTSEGAAANLNYLSERVQSPLTKIMFQDDFLSEDESLRRMKHKMERDNRRWVVSGCNHHYEEIDVTGRHFIPRYSNNIVKGKNTIGAPSVVMFETSTSIRFEEQMVYMFDCEWYLQMRHKIGKPSIVKDPLVTIGIHPSQATHWAKVNLESEINRTKELHPSKLVSSRCNKCTKQVKF